MYTTFSYRTKKKVRTILPAISLLHKLLLRIVKELKEIYYTIGMMATCTACKQERFFTYITYNVDNKTTNQYESLQCSKCRNEEQVSPNSTLIKSKVNIFFNINSIAILCLELQI